MRKLMEAMILEGLVQVALDAQDVFKGGVAERPEQLKLEQLSSRARGAGAGSNFIMGQSDHRSFAQAFACAIDAGGIHFSKNSVQQV